MNQTLWLVTGYLFSISLNYFLIKIHIKQKKSIEEEDLHLYTFFMFIPIINIIMLGLLSIDVLGHQMDKKLEKRNQNKIKKEKPSYLEHFYGIEKQEMFGDVRYAPKKKRGY